MHSGVERLEDRSLLAVTLTATLDGGGNLVITDTGSAANVLTLQLNVAQDSVVITDANEQFSNSAISGSNRSNGNKTMTIPLASITGGAINVLADGLDDSLTINLTNGNFSTKSISYDGGTQTTSDSLTLTGGGVFATVTHTATSASAGSIAVTGNSTITYIGLEPVIDNLSATDRIFTFTGGAETISVTDNIAADGKTQIDSTLSESVYFTNPTGSLTINGGTGADIVTVTSVDAAYTVDLTINGNDGSDTVNLNGDITFASGESLDVNLTNDASGGDLDAIAVGANANLITSGTGTVSLQSSGTITAAAGSSLETVNGGITVAANAAATASGDFVGVTLTGTTLTTSGTGAIAVTGRAVVTGSGGHGVRLQTSSIVQSTMSGATAGTISITGSTQGGTSLVRGVIIAGSALVTSVSGAISITGQGSPTATADSNYGIQIAGGADITSTGTGANAATITLSGTGGTGTGSNLGFNTSGSGSNITTVDGAVSITGQGGISATGSAQEGVTIWTSALIESTGSGTVTITGTAGQGTFSNRGIDLQDSSIVRSTGSGNVVMVGTANTASADSSAFGILVDSGALATTTGTGNLTLRGIGGGTSGGGNSGVKIGELGAASVTSTSSGSITVQARSGTGAGSYGILMEFAGSNITSSGTGSVTLAADNIVLTTGTTIAAGSNVVTLRPATTTDIATDDNGDTIVIGNASGGDVSGSSNQLDVSDDELNLITAGRIVIGNASAGAVALAGGIAAANSTTIEVITGSTINDAGVITFTETNVALNAAGGIGTTSSLDIQVTNLALTAATGGINVTHTGNVNLTTVGGVTGVTTTTSGNVSIAATGSITVSQPVSTVGAGTLLLDAQNGDAGDLIVNNTVTTNSGLLTLRADDDISSNTSGTLTTTSGSVIVNADDDSISGGTITYTAAVNHGSGASIWRLADADGTMNGIISGAGGFAKNGNGTLTLSGTSANTFTGTTTVDVGTLQLSKTAGLIAIGGALTIGNGSGTDTVKLINANQIPDTTDVVIATGGVLNLNGQAETIDALTGSGSVTSGIAGAVTLTIGASNDATPSFSGVISNGSGTVALTKTGSGTQTLAVANNYTGATTISAGRLNVNGSTASGSAVTVQSTGTLGGTGTVAGTVNVLSGGTIAPGTSPGILNSGSVTMTSGTTFAVEIGGTSPGNAITNHDQLNVTGTVDLGGATLTTTAFNSFVPIAGNTFVILKNDGSEAITSTFAGLAEGATITNFLGTTLSATITYVANTDLGSVGNDIVLTTFASAPLETSVTLDGSNNLVVTDINGGTSNDTLTIQSDTANSRFVISDPGNVISTSIAGATGSGSNTVTIPFGSVVGSQIFVNTLDGNDSLAIDLSLGNFSKTVTFDGGTQSTSDSLTVLGGGTFATVTHSFTSASSGTIDISSNSLISYLGLEPVTDNLSATDRIFTFNGGAETITVSDSGGADGKMTIDSTLGESVTFSNPTNSLTINAGSGDDIINITSVDAAFDASLTINGDAATDTVTLSAALSLAAGKNVSVTADTISVTASITTTDAGSISLDADGAAVGDVTIQAALTSASGAITLRADDDILANTSGTITTASGAVSLTADDDADASGTITYAAAVNHGSAGSTFSLADADGTMTGVISGTGGVTKAGTGRLDFTGISTYLGSTTINAGTLGTGSNSANIGDGSATNVLVFNGGKLLMGGFISPATRPVSFLADATINDASTNNTIAGDISGAGGLTKQGNGILTLSGTNSFGGVGQSVSLESGTLSVANDGNLGDAANSIVFSAGSATLRATSSFATNRAIALTVGGALDAYGAFELTVDGQITGTGNLEVQSTGGGGVVVLSNSSNSYSGATLVSSGTVRVTADNALGTTAGGTFVSTGAVLDVANVAYAATESVTLNGGTLATSTGTSSFAGPIALDTGSPTVDVTGTELALSNVISGTRSLTKTGAGTLLLTGSSTYSGSTILNAGTLATDNDSTSIGDGSATNSLVFNGGTLFMGGFVSPSTRPVIFMTDGNIRDAGGNNSIEGVISGPGGLIKRQNGVLTLTNTNTFGGAGETLFIEAGTISVSTDAGLGDIGNTIEFGTDAGTLRATSSFATNRAVLLTNSGRFDTLFASTLTVNGLVSGPGNLRMGFVDQNGTIEMTNGLNSYNGRTYVDFGTLRVTADHALGTTAFGVELSVNTVLDLANVIYSTTEEVLINGGTLSTSVGTSSLAGAVFLESATATVDVDGTQLTLLEVVSGSQALLKTGLGTLVLSAINTYEGPTTVSAGTLLVHGSLFNGVPSPDVIVQSGATLGGAGTIHGSASVLSGATISPTPGAGTSSLGVGGVTLTSGATYSISINGTAPDTQHDQLDVTGAVVLGNATLSATLGYAPLNNDEIVLIANDGLDPVSGIFNGLPEGSVVSLSGSKFVLSYVGGTDNNDVVFVADTVAPSILSFTRFNPATSPTNADVLVFRATFSEDVLNVSLADFAVDGASTATVTLVTPISGSVYDVTVSMGDLASFNGLVGLNLAVAQDITDIVSFALPTAEPVIDETYLLDNIAPSTTSFTRFNPATSPTNADVLIFRATFSEDVLNVSTADFTVDGASTAIVSLVTPISGSIYEVTVSTGNLPTFNGLVGLNFAVAHDITDSVGNLLPTSEPGIDQSYLLDNLAPSITSFTRFNPATSPTSANVLVFRATFSEVVVNVSAADFAVSGGSTAVVTTVTPVSGSLYEITVEMGDIAGFNGLVGLNIAVGQNVTDSLGNALPTTEPLTDETYQLDNTPPTVDIIDVTPDPRGTPVASITIVFNEPVTGFNLSDLTLTRDAGPNLLTGAQILSSADNITWTLSNLTNRTNVSGAYLLTLTAAGSGIADTVGSLLATDAIDAWDAVIIVSSDFGDAPDFYGTLLVSNGPRHAVPGPQLGTTRDSEVDAQLPLDGTGDDVTNTGSVDDEDGVLTLAPLVRFGSSAVTLSSPGGGKLDAWIDLNANGTFDDPTERLGATGLGTPGSVTLGAGSTTIVFTVPASVPTSASPTYGRFRLSTAGGLSPTDLFDAVDGEVEDHIFAIVAAPASVLIDDSYAGATPGDVLDGGIFGVDRFDTIAQGLLVVATSGTVAINPGTYPEVVTITRDITLTGQSGTASDVVINPPGVAASGITITNTATTVTVSDLSVTSSCHGLESNTAGTLTLDNVDLSGNACDGLHATAAATINITGSKFASNGEDGIDIASAASSISISSSSGLGNTMQGLNVVSSDNTTLDGGSWSGIRVRSTDSFTIDNNAVTATKPVDVETQNETAINASLDAVANTIRFTANRDAIGSQGFTQASGTSITTTDDGPTAVSITVNTLLGGDGSAVIAAINAGLTPGSSGGRVTVSALMGAIADGNGSSANITAGNAVLMGSGGVGSVADPIETTVGNLEGAGGTGGFFVTDSNALTIGDITTVVGVSTSTGDIEVRSTGAMTVSENVIGGGLVFLHAQETPGTGDDLVVQTGVTIRSVVDDVDLEAGDDINLQAGSLVEALGAGLPTPTVFLKGDCGNADAPGSTITINGLINSLAGATVNGDTDADTIIVNALGSGGLTVDGLGSDDNYVITYPDLPATFGSTITVDDSISGDDRVTVNGTNGSDEVFFTTKNPPTTAATEEVSRGTLGSEKIVLHDNLERLEVFLLGANDLMHAQPSMLFPIRLDGGDPDFGDPGVPPGDVLDFDPLGNSFVADCGLLSIAGGSPDPFFGVEFVHFESLPLSPLGTTPGGALFFDFNHTNTAGAVGPSPTQPGYVGVLPTTLFSGGSGFGWQSAVKSFERDDGFYDGSFQNLIRDGHWLDAPATFTADLPNGWYSISAMLGSPYTSVSGVSITNADTSSTLASGITTGPGESKHVNFIALVTDGTLDLTFGPATVYPQLFALNGLTIRPANLFSMGLGGVGAALSADGVSINSFPLLNGPINSLVTVTTTLGTIVNADSDNELQGIQVPTNGLGQATILIRRPTGAGEALVSIEAVSGEKSGCSAIEYVLPTGRNFDFNHINTNSATGQSPT